MNTGSKKYFGLPTALLCVLMLSVCGGPTSSIDKNGGDANAGSRNDNSEQEGNENSGNEGEVCSITEEGAFLCEGGEGGGTGTGTGTEGGGTGTGTGTEGGGTGTGTGTGTEGGGTGTGTGTGTGGEPECFAEQFTPQSQNGADLLLVVDRSGSMEEVPPGAGYTKWDSVRAVVTAVTSELDDELGFGLMFYPAGDNQALQCMAGSVAVNIQDGASGSIAQAFATTGPGGGTPTAPTLQVAHTYLSNRTASRPQAVVLATDGAPNCNASNDPSSCVCSQATNCGHSYSCLDDAAAVQSVNNLAGSGLATFIIGIPGSELFAQVLDNMAIAGGTAVAGVHKYYEANSGTELEQALRSISQRVTNCRFELQGAPNMTSVEVTINGVQQNRDGLRVSGWDYVGANTIEFFGTACQQLTNSQATVEVTYCTIQGG